MRRIPGPRGRRGPPGPSGGGALSAGQWFWNVSFNSFAVLATNVNSNFIALPEEGFAEAVSDANFSFDPAGCVITYVGAETKKFMLALDVTLAGHSGDRPLIAGIAKNGDLVGVDSQTPQPFVLEADSIGNQSGAFTVAISIHRVASLSTGDTFQPVVANLLGDQLTDLLWLNLSAIG